MDKRATGTRLARTSAEDDPSEGHGCHDVPCSRAPGAATGAGTVGTRRVLMKSRREQPLAGGHQMRRWDDVPQPVRTGWHYTRAPIVEAIIDVRCDLPPETVLSDLATVPAEGFGSPEQTYTVTGLLDVRPDGVESRTVNEQTGYIFRSHDNRRIIQSRLDGFSFAHLAPYERWDRLYSDAERHWLRYRDAARPLRVRRLGVRYVNRLEVLGEPIEIADYLRTAVDVSPYLPQMVQGYFLQVILPLSRFRATTAITSAVAPPSAPTQTALILDIDTWQELDVDLSEDGASQAIAEGLASLREAKNYVFEACITDATRRLIE